VAVATARLVGAWMALEPPQPTMVIAIAMAPELIRPLVVMCTSLAFRRIRGHPLKRARTVPSK